MKKTYESPEVEVVRYSFAEVLGNTITNSRNEGYAAGGTDGDDSDNAGENMVEGPR